MVLHESTKIITIHPEENMNVWTKFQLLRYFSLDKSGEPQAVHS